MCAKRLFVVCASCIKYELFFLRKFLHYVFVFFGLRSEKMLVISNFAFIVNL